jgi:hypothetical protein
MKVRMLMIACLLSTLFTSAQSTGEQHYVILPASKARNIALEGIASQGTWQPTKEDIDGLEASLSQISTMKIEGWPATLHIVHPEKYFRQYVPIIQAGQKRIYVNAFCDEQFFPHWRDQLVEVMDGDICYYHALYDPASKKFSNLKINGRA